MPVGQSASAPLLRLLNAQTAFEVVRREKAISRVDLARATGMAKPTVSNVLQDLQTIGLVRETPGDQRQRGMTFELMPASALISVSMSAGVIPADGHVCRLNPERVESYPIVEVLEQTLGHPAVVENDINLAAIGEQAKGLGSQAADFVFLSVGTGVGAGLVLGGELHRGRFGAAGEIDMPGDPDSPSEPALLSYARGVYGADAPPTVEAIFAAAESGDTAANQVVREEARRIASQLVPIARVVDVELIVLGGGIGTRCGRLIDDVSRHLTGRVHYPPRLAVSTLGDSAVLTGALAFGAQNCGERVVAERLARRSPRDGMSLAANRQKATPVNVSSAHLRSDK
jgi:predicted NBD/HSP70 family sugar kinase